ncbi:MAG: radical SAM family heme chaperone HemW [Treponema sp.]|nr:radical SAM family heme chaperone HemW [Treponema sp.]
MELPLYIHIPFCKKKCDYCDFFSLPLCKIHELKESYVQALVNQIIFFVQKYNVTKWSTVYIGGGTPSLLGPQLIEFLASNVYKSTGQNSTDEFTIEVNPDDLTGEIIDSCRRGGITRISMGIQALDDAALSAVGRLATRQKALDALSLLNECWDGRLSVDFIAGLPLQTIDSFKSQFEYVFNSRVDHISLYSLTVEENTPLYKNIEDGKIKWNSDWADRMWALGRRILEKNGFAQYEVSNFARPGKESLHNQAYWNLKDYVGCGAGATGTFYEKGLRFTNRTDVQKYIDFWSRLDSDKNEFELCEVEKLDKETQIFEYLMMGFRMLRGVSSKAFAERFGVSLEKRIGVEVGVFDEWKKNRLARKTSVQGDIYYSLNKKGITLLNLFLEQLL